MKSQISNQKLQIAFCFLLLASFFFSCNKPFDNGLSIELQNPTRFSLPICYSTYYSYDQRDYNLKYNTGWYDMYQCIYKDEAPGYLGKLYSGTGSIKYNTDEYTLVEAGFNPHDEQGYYELPDHITRFFQRHFSKSDSTLNVFTSRGDSLVFNTKNPDKYAGLLEVQVMQTVDLYTY